MNINIDKLYLSIRGADLSPVAATALANLNARVTILETKEQANMATIQDLVTKIAAEHTAIGSLITLVGGLKQQVVDALAQAGQLSPEVQAAVDAAFATVDGDTQAISDALGANVVADPATPAPADGAADPGPN